MAPPTAPWSSSCGGRAHVTADGSTIRVECDRAAFVTPSANIACVLTRSCNLPDLRQDLHPRPGGDVRHGGRARRRGQRDADDRRVRGLDLRPGGTLQRTPASAPAAGGDPRWTATPWRSTVPGWRFAYGERLAGRARRCESSDAGVTFGNPELDGRRFVLSRGDLQLRPRPDQTSSRRRPAPAAAAPAPAHTRDGSLQVSTAARDQRRAVSSPSQPPTSPAPRCPADDRRRPPPCAAGSPVVSTAPGRRPLLFTSSATTQCVRGGRRRRCSASRSGPHPPQTAAPSRGDRGPHVPVAHGSRSAAGR